MMKKTFTLLTLIAAFVMGADAQSTVGRTGVVQLDANVLPATVSISNIDENKSYNLFSRRGALMAVTPENKPAEGNYDANKLNAGRRGGNITIQMDKNDVRQQFLLLRTSNTPASEYYLYNVTNQKFVSQEAGSHLNVHDSNLQALKFASINYDGGTRYQLQKTDGSKVINLNDNNFGYIFNDYKRADPGNAFVILEAKTEEPTAVEAAKLKVANYELSVAMQDLARVNASLVENPTLGQYVKPADWDNVISQLNQQVTNANDYAKKVAVTAAIRQAVNSLSLKLPEQYQVFRIQLRSNPSKYVHAVNANGVNALAIATTTDENSLFMYVGNKLLSVASGKHVGYSGDPLMVAYGQAGKNIAIAESPYKRGYYTVSVDGNYIVAYNDGRVRVNASSNLAAYQNDNAFNLIPVTEIPLTAKVQLESGAQVGTFYTPVEGQVEGAKAYTGKYNAQTQRVDFTEIPDGKIPAGSAFVFENDGTFRIGSVSAPALLNNDLVGYDVSTNTAGANDYHLSLSKKKFIKVTGAKRAFRAYLLNLNAGSGVQGFDLNFGNPTAIETIASETNDAPIFDLSGRRVNKAQQGGIYLQNGKKFIR